MANPLSGFFGGGGPQQQNPNLNNIANLVGQFQQFRNNFKGDPRQIVESLRRSGRMSEAQFQQLQQLATQLQNFMK